MGHGPLASCWWTKPFLFSSHLCMCLCGHTAENDSFQNRHTFCDILDDSCIESCKGCCGIVVCIPYFPCRSLSLSSKERNWSHPVEAWKTDTCTARYRNDFPVPNAIQSSAAPSNSNLWNTPFAITRMSVYAVQIISREQSCLPQSALGFEFNWGSSLCVTRREPRHSLSQYSKTSY